MDIESKNLASCNKHISKMQSKVHVTKLLMQQQLKAKTVILLHRQATYTKHHLVFESIKTN